MHPSVRDHRRLRNHRAGEGEGEGEGEGGSRERLLAPEDAASMTREGNVKRSPRAPRTRVNTTMLISDNSATAFSRVVVAAR